MFRYIAAAAIAALLLAVALKAHGPDESPAATVSDESPEISVTEVSGGKRLTVRHRFAGSVSRATLVYDLDGREQTADRRTDCQQSLENSSIRDSSYVTEVVLSGKIPDGASHIRLVLEDETGIRIVPLELQ